MLVTEPVMGQGAAAVRTRRDVYPAPMLARATRTDWTALAALTALAGALRLPGAGTDLWLDEVVSLVRYFRLSPLEVLSTYASPNQHLLYSLAASVSIASFGEHAWSARLPALLFGILTPAAVYLFVRSVGSRREAVLTALLVAVSYHHVWFSQNARGYAAMVFWVSLGAWLLVRAVGSDRRTAWTGYAACMILGTGFLLNAAFVALGNALAVLLLSFRPEDTDVSPRRLRRGALLSLVAISLGSLLLYAAVVDDIVRFFVETERTGLGSGVRGPLQLAQLFSEGLRRGTGGIGIAVLGIGLLTAVGAYETWKRDPLVVLMAVGGPLFGVAAILLLNYGAYPRAFLYVLPLALLFVVRGCDVVGRGLAEALGDRAPGPGPEAKDGSSRRATLSRERRAHATGTALVGATILLSAVSLAVNWRHPKQDYSGALRWARQRASTGDIVAAAGMAGFVFREVYAPDIVVLDSTEDLDAAVREAERVWVLYSFPRDMRLRFPRLYEAIERRGEPPEPFPGTVGDGTLYVTAVTR